MNVISYYNLQTQQCETSRQIQHTNTVSRPGFLCLPAYPVCVTVMHIADLCPWPPGDSLSARTLLWHLAPLQRSSMSLQNLAAAKAMSSNGDAGVSSWFIVWTLCCHFKSGHLWLLQMASARWPPTVRQSHWPGAFGWGLTQMFVNQKGNFPNISFSLSFPVSLPLSLSPSLPGKERIEWTVGCYLYIINW